MQRRTRTLPLSKNKKTILPGVYLIYYRGREPLYKLSLPSDKPIYIGKTERGVYYRLLEHTKSIMDTTNLKIEDFRCKIVSIPEKSIIPMVESMLIENYQPFWNVALRGFGNHKPGRARNDSDLSDWDKAHPGREIMLDVRTPKLEGGK